MPGKVFARSRRVNARHRRRAVGATAVVMLATTLVGASGIPRASAGKKIDQTAPSGITGADENFDYSALVWQGYWLSRDHFGPFVMGSGLGVPFEPPMEMVQQAMAMIAKNPNDPVAIPTNLAPLMAVYASADPALVNDPTQLTPLDFSAFRLDPASFDTTVRVRAQAETMLKESQWAHNFADEHFGDPAGSFGAQQRFVGQMVNLVATTQGRYAMRALAGPDGLYRDSDGTLDYTANWVLLHAFTDLADLANGSSGAGRYMNPEAAAAFSGGAQVLLGSLANRTPETIEESTAAIRALAFVAATQSSLAPEAGSRLESIAAQLQQAAASTPRERGAAIAGLVAAAVATDDSAALQAASRSFAALRKDFDPETGVYRSTDTYTVDDVAWIIGGLNSLAQEGRSADRAAAARQLLAFYEATLSIAGMQLSAPQGKDGAMAGTFEKDLPDVSYYHPVDTPTIAASKTLPVPAAEIRIDGGTWTVTDRRFVVAGAMHLANELNWLGPHLGSIPFPDVDAAKADTSSSATTKSAATATSRKVKVSAKNTQYDTDRIAITAGTDVAVTFANRDDGVSHNIHFQAGAAGDVKTKITPGPDTQRVTVRIDQPGTYKFSCDVHPNMVGELVVA